MSQLRDSILTFETRSLAISPFWLLVRSLNVVLPSVTQVPPSHCSAQANRFCLLRERRKDRGLRRVVLMDSHEFPAIKHACWRQDKILTSLFPLIFAANCSCRRAAKI